MVSFKDKLNKLFLNDIILNNKHYSLNGIIFNQNANHYFALFFNNNVVSFIKDKIWLFHDDMNGSIVILDNNEIGYNNYRISKTPCLFIYIEDSSNLHF